MKVNKFYINDWFVALKYTLTPTGAFTVESSSASNQNQASYMVYTVGAVTIENINKSFVYTRNAGETTDTSAVDNMPEFFTLETESPYAEFFCLSKLSQEKIIRVEHRLNAGDLITVGANLIFVAMGNVVVNGADISGANVFDNASGAVVTAKTNAFVIEIS